jgi:hypothetical protein
MNFDTTGAEVFLAYLEGHTSLRQVLAHPAYQEVSRHAQKYAKEGRRAAHEAFFLDSDDFMRRYQHLLEI